MSLSRPMRLQRVCKDASVRFPSMFGPAIAVIQPTSFYTGTRIKAASFLNNLGTRDWWREIAKTAGPENSDHSQRTNRQRVIDPLKLFKKSPASNRVPLRS